MITAYWRPKNKIVQTDIKALKSKRVVWVDCVNPTDAELEKISAYTHVSVADFKDHTIDYERPNTFEFDTYSLIVFGVPVMNERYIKRASFAIFLFKNKNIVTLHREEIGGLSRFSNELLEKNPRYFDFHTKVIRVMLETIVDDYFNLLDAYQDTADRIESTIFHKPQGRAIEDVFKLKKSLLLFHKSLLANREVITAIEKEYVVKLSRKELYEFRDIYNDLVQLIDAEETLRDILTGVIDIYMTSISNNLNQTIKRLTVVASYVMIPTLIASIYGMNFRFMPEIHWKWGYPFSLGMMIISIAGMYYYFKKTNML
ncbi:magnesium/cobalt transporter CorA [Candidatus Woesearchaeota archaeon]|nr:magnesium/cobalt transporter CorA [Candidatus Woesearchaeota archaeon]